MSNDIKFQDENHLPNKKDWDDLRWIEEFYEFLQGNIPDSIRLARGHKPKMSQKKRLR